MSQILEQIRQLVAAGDVQVSTHGDEELAKDQIAIRELLPGVQYAVVVEDYPQYAKGPCVLLLHRLSARFITMVNRLADEETMSSRKHTKLLREGDYLAEV